MDFPVSQKAIHERINAIDPEAYARSRNFKEGAVTYLSPYISRGYISTKQLFEIIMNRGLDWEKVEKFVQELAWRDYWQQVWVQKGDEINRDLKRPQEKVDHSDVPQAIVNATTGITAVDEAIDELYTTGYMHNHMRMYVASIACNIGRAHWLSCAQWMYSHLLDGDWASNALSWQWVAGSNANKKYYANQDNINNYFNSEQGGTFLDVNYSQFEFLGVPPSLRRTEKFATKTLLPQVSAPRLDPQLPTLVYTYYNIDPEWYKGENMNRVLLLEPSFFEKYPIAEGPLNFAIELAQSIPTVQLFVGEFKELQNKVKERIIYKEHPTQQHFEGQEEARDWMFDVQGYYPSFFGFWKKCMKQMKEELWTT